MSGIREPQHRIVQAAVLECWERHLCPINLSRFILFSCSFSHLKKSEFGSGVEASVQRCTWAKSWYFQETQEIWPRAPPHTHTLLMSSITQRTSDLHCEALCHSKHLLFSFTLNGRHNYLEHAPLHLPRSILENLEVFRLFCDVLVGTNRRNISFLMPLCTNYSHWAAICWPANEIG